MDRIYKYNPDITYKPNQGRYLQLINAKYLYIQNITVAEHDSFQVKFPNIFTNYPLGAVKVEDQRFIDWDHYKFTLWQTQLNFMVFCASSACSVSVKHMNAKKQMIRSIYHFHVHYHIRRIFKILKLPLPYQNSFNQYNSPYNHEQFLKIFGEYGVSNDLTKYARSKVDYVISEFIYMLPSNMNLWIGKVKNYSNKILISSPSFKIGTN